MTAAELAARLGAKQVRVDRWKAKCPAHEDSKPSLLITAAKNGNVLIRCWAGCDAGDVVKALGLEWKDLCAEGKPNGKTNGRRRVVPVEGIHCTDLGNATRFIVEHHDRLRYVYPWRRWLWWDETRWTPDDSGYVCRMAAQIPRVIGDEAQAEDDPDRRKALRTWANTSESAARQIAMIELARSDSLVVQRPGDFDRDPFALNVANGTIDLHIGQLRPHRREDLIRRLAPVDFAPGAPCPLWLSFLERVLPAPAVRAFFQRAVGYSLTGDISEHALFLLYGLGANGKSVALKIIQEVLGDYGRSIKADVFTDKKNQSGVDNALAALDGPRFVSISETDTGARLAEGLVKDYTGGDRVSARFLFAEWFDFDPQFKLWIRTNHKPVIRGTDDGIWRRIKLVPFTVKIPEAEQDKQLTDKLRVELPGVLRWAVEGCLAWQRDGLSPPAEVRAATAAYRDEQDPLGGWIADCCSTGEAAKETVKAAKETVKALYASYEEWCKSNGEEPLPKRAWGQRLDDRGIVSDRIRGGTRVRVGLALGSGDVTVTPFPDPSPYTSSREKDTPSDVTQASPVTPVPCPDHRTAPGGQCACWHRSRPS